MNKPTKPNIVIPESFAENGIKTDFDNEKLTNGFDRLQPDVLAGDNLNKFIDDTYKGLNGVLDLYKGAVLYDVNETYSNKSIIFNIDENNEIKIYRSLVNNNIGNDLDDTDYWQEVQFGGDAGLEIGDISTALYVDESLNKRRYLNGQIIENNKIHKNIIDFLIELKNTNPELFTTESNWQAEAGLSVFGQVGKFVFNYDTDDETILSARLPRVINIQGVQGSSGLGALVRESLPNITGEINAGTSEYGIFWAGSNYNASGAFVLSDFNGKQSTGSEAKKAPKKVNIDASCSNSTYQDNAPVQQEAVQYRYFIQINTGSERKEDVLSTLKQNTPYSLFESKYSDHQLNNASWLLSNGQFNPKTVYVTCYEALEVEYNSEIEIGASVDLPSGTSYVKQGLSVRLWTDESATDYDFRINTADETFRLPLKTILSNDSDLYLYYYVGETVQDADLIDAGRIGEQLANKQDKCIHITETYRNGASWYRVYSDGWCEQGGRYTINTNGSGTITFLKEFVDTFYTIFNCKESIDSSSWTVMFDGFGNRTTSQIVIKANLTGYTIGGSWEAKGYIS